jgi:hypothetical protein
MKLDEFIADQVQILKDFEHHWLHLVKTGKARTKFLPETRWKDEFQQFMERYSNGESNRPQDEDEEATTHKRKAA